MERNGPFNQLHSGSADSEDYSDSSLGSEARFDTSGYALEYDCDTDDLFDEMLEEPAYSAARSGRFEKESPRRVSNWPDQSVTRQQQQKQQPGSSGLHNKQGKSSMPAEVIVIPDTDDESKLGTSSSQSNSERLPRERPLIELGSAKRRKQNRVVVDLTKNGDSDDSNGTRQRPHFNAPRFSAPPSSAFDVARQSSRNDYRTLGSLASLNSTRSPLNTAPNFFYRQLISEAFLSTSPPSYRTANAPFALGASDSFSALDPFELFGTADLRSGQGPSGASRRFMPHLGQTSMRWEERQPSYEELLSISERIGTVR
jgi:hypothetical protein